MSEKIRIWGPVLYWLGINLIAFLQFGMDKQRARKGKWRISEKMLFLTAVLGGSIGSIMGMKYFHHKTLHRKFRIGLPFLLLIQIVLTVGIGCILLTK